MKNHYIYETTNIINGKKYIGKRSCECNISEDPYLGSGKYIKRAIKKHGKDCFVKKIIEVCGSESEAFEREKYYISQYNAVSDKNYYNIASGGEGGFGCFAGKSEDEIQLWKQRMSASRKGRVITPEWKQKILETRKKKGIGVGEKNGMYGRKNMSISKPVVMISLNGNVLKHFIDAADANSFLDKPRGGSLINRVCNKKEGTAFNYFWLFESDYNEKVKNNTYKTWIEQQIQRYVYKIKKVNKSKIQKNSKTVYQLDIATLDVINEYDSICIASEKTGIQSQSIYRVCNHGCNTAGGFSWCYKEEYIHSNISELKKLYSRKVSDSENFRHRPQTKIPIYCVTTNQKFDGACDAIEFFGLCKGTKIQDVCKGKRKYAGRHPQTNEPMVWMYFDDYLKKIS